MTETQGANSLLGEISAPSRREAHLCWGVRWTVFTSKSVCLLCSAPQRVAGRPLLPVLR